jgi:hypothetical protein
MEISWRATSELSLPRNVAQSSDRKKKISEISDSCQRSSTEFHKIYRDFQAADANRPPSLIDGLRSPRRRGLSPNGVESIFSAAFKSPERLYKKTD